MTIAVFSKSLKSMGSNNFEEGQTVRVVQDRVLLRSGLPTIQFTGRDCLERPQAVAAERLSILETQTSKV